MRRPTVVALAAILLLGACGSTPNAGPVHAAAQGESTTPPDVGVDPTCVAMAQIVPTPVGAGAEARENQPPICNTAPLPPVVPAISTSSYPNGEPFPCIDDSDAIGDYPSYDMAEELLSSLEWADDYIATWVEVTEPDVSLSPSLEYPPYSFDLSDATGNGTAPDWIYGREALIAAIAIADGSPVRIGISSFASAAGVGVQVSESSGWVPTRGCSSSYIYTALDEYLQATGQPSTLRAANDLYWSILGHPDAAMLDRAAFRQQLEGLRTVPTPTAVPVAWQDVSPEHRSLTDAPAEIREILQSVVLFVELPPTWAGAAGHLCTRSVLGWGGSCTHLDFETGPPGSFEAFLPLQVVREPGGTVEIVLFGDEGMMFGPGIESLPPHRVLGSVDPDAVSAGNPLINVVITATVGVEAALDGLGMVSVAIAQ